MLRISPSAQRVATRRFAQPARPDLCRMHSDVSDNELEAMIQATNALLEEQSQD